MGTCEDAERTVVCVHGLTRQQPRLRLSRPTLRWTWDESRGAGSPRPRAAVLRSSNAEDYGTPLYLAVMGALVAHLGVREIDWVRYLAGRPHRNGAGRTAGKSISAVRAQLASARACPPRPCNASAAICGRPGTFATLALTPRHTCARSTHHSAPLSDAQWRHLCQPRRHRGKRAAAAELRSQDRGPVLATACSCDVSAVARLGARRVSCADPGHELPTCCFYRETVVEMKRRGLAADQGRVAVNRNPQLRARARALSGRRPVRLVEDFLPGRQAASAHPVGARRREAASVANKGSIGHRGHRHHSRRRHHRLTRALSAAARPTN